MHSKIYKARLASLQANQPDNMNGAKDASRQGCHPYFGALQHIFQRNKQMIRELKLSGKGFYQAQGSKDQQPSKKEKPSGRIRLVIRRNYSSQKGSLLEDPQLILMAPIQKSYYKSGQQPAKKIIEEPQNFVPIGQASQFRYEKKRSTKPLTERENEAQTSLLHTERSHNSFSAFNYEGSLRVSKPKMNKRASRSVIKMKSEGSEETNHSSIRNSQRTSSSRKNSIGCLPINESTEVTPW